MSCQLRNDKQFVTFGRKKENKKIQRQAEWNGRRGRQGGKIRDEGEGKNEVWLAEPANRYGLLPGLARDET